MKVKAFAKINLGLRVLAKRKDGYHNIDTVFAEVDLVDEIEIKARKDKEIKIEGMDLPLNENSILQAIFLLQRFSGEERGVDIKITKRIPMAAGLGGGSADASATLKALNKLWKLKLSEERLQHLATKLGADSPFFIRGGIQRGRGIGERLKDFELPKKFPREVVIVNPEIPVSTKWAYENIELPQKWIEVKPGEIINDFEKLLFAKLPLLKKIKSAIKRSGGVEASLSGSGSALFGLYQTKKKAKEALVKLEKYGKVFHTKIQA